MALMLSRTYDALRAAGAPEDKARAAAEEIASLDNRLTRLATKVNVNIALSVAILVAILAPLLN